MCERLSPVETTLNVTLLIHAKEMGRVSNTGLLAQKILKSSKRVFYGTPSYRFHPAHVHKDHMQNLILYPDANMSIEDHFEQGYQPEDVNLVVPDGNWTQAHSMTKKLIASRLFRPVKLKRPKGGRYWLRLEHNHEMGVSTLEAVASTLEAFGQNIAAVNLRQALEYFVHESLIIRSKHDMASKYIETSAYLVNHKPKP